MSTVRVVPFPDPVLTGPPCRVCAGRGVTGERYLMQAGSGEPALRLDVFCPACDGCGQADHSQCTPDKHANSETDDWAVDLAEEVCPSCWGRGWWPVQGWPAVDAPDRVLTLRVPCGCTTDRAELVERTGEAWS